MNKHYMNVVIISETVRVDKNMDDVKQEKEEATSTSVIGSCDIESGDVCKSGGDESMGSALEMNSDELNEDVIASPAIDVPANDADAVGQLDASPIQQQRIMGPHQQKNSPRLLSSTIDNQILLAVIAVGVCCGIWYYRRFKRQQKEWQELSSVQLENIIERSHGSPRHHIELSKESKKSDSATTDESDLTQAGKYHSYGDVSTDHGPLHDVSSSSPSIHRDFRQSTDDNSNTEQLSISSSSLTNIRARQQELHEKRTANAKQQRRQQQKLRQQHLVDSLQHDVADEALKRRKKAIISESKANLLSTIAEDRQQTLLEELQEMERTALLQQQNQEYNESLEQDRERARVKSLKLQKYKKREHAISHAKYRLVRAGVKISGLLDSWINELPRSCDLSGDIKEMKQENEMNVQVRLLLPSGQKVQASFADSHLIGLIYDFALVSLDREKLLLPHQEIKEEHDDEAERYPMEHSASDSSFDPVDYAVIRSEWGELFPAFSLVTTYPRTAHTDLTLTLNQSGFCQNVSLLVVIDSD